MKTKAVRSGVGVNEVHRNSVHAENLSKEMKYLDKNKMDHFQLNPNNSNI